MWCRRGIRREATEGSGWGDGRMRVSRRGRGGRGRSRARSNGKKPYPMRVRLARRCWRRHSPGRWRKLRARRHSRRARGRRSAERYKARRGRAGVIKGAFERHSAVDVRMQREQARTVRSFK